MMQGGTKEYEVTGSKGNRLHVAETGSGPVVVMLHGGAGCGGNFSRQTRILSEQYRVIAPDLRGHGRSAWIPGSTVYDFYADVLAMFEELNLEEPFHLVGHSFGGYLAARYAAEHGDRLRSLALLNTGGDLPRRTLAYKFLETFSGCADAVRRRIPWLVNTNSEVASCLMRKTFREWDSWSMFPRIKVPTLVVLGAFDPLIPLDRGRKMAQAIPHAMLQVLSLGGHVSMIDKPRYVTSLLMHNFARKMCLNKEMVLSH